jgi:WD40 repeat protein
MNQRGSELTVKSEVHRVAWSSTEEHIVTLSNDGILWEWSGIFESPKLVAVSTEKHKGALHKYSPDDRLIASVKWSSAKLWDASNLSLVWKHLGLWHSFAVFHPSGNRIFFNGISSSNSIVIDVNAQDLGNITTAECSLDLSVNDLVFDSSGTICVARMGEDVKIHNAYSLEETASLPCRNVKAMRFTPDGDHILLVLESKTLVLWDIAANAIVQELTLDLPISSGIRFARISNDCGIVHVYNYSGNHVVHLRY